MIKALIFKKEGEYNLILKIYTETKHINTFKTPSKAIKSVITLKKEIPALKCVLDRTTAKELQTLPSGVIDIEIYEEI